ncbi:hypothetical protein SLS56_006589 [Neofusicoccum ribis]|uniref:NACHT domain-containing protein n=1 Tax=Neofusicoccum ribis TaxID=45134 RepID=A0ABR3SQS9_9PEZI
MACLKTAASGTCAWVFETQEFVQWKEIQPPALFWVTGGPGMGKTVLSTFLVDNVLDQLESHNRSDTKARLAYFFCDNSNKNRCSALAILRGLLYQLCRADHDLMKNHMQRECAAQINPSEGMLENFDALWRVFESILGDPRTGEVIVIIDALDECEVKSQATFLEYLMRILSRQGRTGAAALKVIVTSRHSKTIGPYMSGRAHHLHMDSRRIAGDLKAFISGKVRQLSETNHYPEDLRQEVERKLLLNHGGTFLWVYLAVSQLEDVRTPNVLEYLDQFPTDIFDIYDRILERIPHKYREDARFVFRIVAAAERPLTKIEVCRAFSISSKKSWSSAWANPEPSETYSRDRLQMQIFDYCSDFVHFEKQGDTESLHLIHYSAKEYLLNDAVYGFVIVGLLLNNDDPLMIGSGWHEEEEGG